MKQIFTIKRTVSVLMCIVLSLLLSGCSEALRTKANKKVALVNTSKTLRMGNRPIAFVSRTIYIKWKNAPRAKTREGAKSHVIFCFIKQVIYVKVASRYSTMTVMPNVFITKYFSLFSGMRMLLERYNLNLG